MIPQRARTIGLVALLAAVHLALPALLQGGEHSRLWGAAGDRWEPRGRLPDFSYAGYRRGERPIPERSRHDVRVTEFGARGDDDVDDTSAFRDALAASAGKVVLVPAGRYVLRGFVDLRSSGTVLRGEGPERTVLVCPTPLNDIEPNWGATTTGQRTSNYSWSGGIVRIAGDFPRDAITSVTEPALRGDTTLAVSSCNGLEAGAELRLTLRDTREDTLARHLYADDPGPLDNVRGRTRESFAFRVTRVDAEARRLTIDRPLRTDVRLEWEPRLFAASSSVEDAGIEALSFEFPVTPYEGHFTERGFNAIAVSNARNCWIRDVWIRHSDSGIFIRGENITLERIVLESARPTERSRRATGHHGVTLGGQDNLLREFDIRTRFMHDITVTSGSAGNVVSRGRGVDLALDHHCRAPHSNLFTDIDLGEGSRMFQSGGGAKLGRHSGAHETFWCVRSRRPQAWPKGWGPDRMNIVGVRSDAPATLEPDGRWLEPIAPASLEPRDLHAAQLARRLARRETE